MGGGYLELTVSKVTGLKLYLESYLTRLPTINEGTISDEPASC